MQLRPLFISMFYLFGSITGHQYLTRLKRSMVDRSCHVGCLTCSEFNGCLSCKPRLFFHLELSGISEHGVCLPYCPRGHYGNRSPHVNRCIRCSEECVSCFSKGFCTRCRTGLFLLWGRCMEHCPDLFYPDHSLRECRECSVGCAVCVSANSCLRCKTGLYQLKGQCLLSCPEGFEPDEKHKECIPSAHCEVGEWGEWSPCSHRGKTCGFRRGEKTRKRELLQTVPLGENLCIIPIETRNCIVQKTKCPEQ